MELAPKEGNSEHQWIWYFPSRGMKKFQQETEFYSFWLCRELKNIIIMFVGFNAVEIIGFCKAVLGKQMGSWRQIRVSWGGNC